jgi:putative addiction module component (TIGR02574 family)
MSEAAEKLKPLLAALPAAERIELIEYLIALDEEADPGELDDEYIDEINRRIADSEAGKTDSMPHEEFMRQMKEKYG